MLVNKQLKGMLLIELLISLSVLLIISDPLFKTLNTCINQLVQLKTRHQDLVEKMEMYIQIQNDIITSKSQTPSNCCLQTSNHLICYGIHNNGLRRQKKKLDSIRFFTSYMGTKKHWKTIGCSREDNNLKVTATNSYEELEWNFYVKN